MQNNINSNWKYRQFMTQNGLSIMQANNIEACNTLGLSTHVPTDTTPSSNVPHL